MLVVWNIAETYSEPSQTSKMEFFLIIVNDGKLLSIFAKKSILNVCLRFWILLSIVSHCVGSVRIRSFSGPFFPAFGLNTNRIQMRENTVKKNSEFGHFSHSVMMGKKYQIS